MNGSKDLHNVDTDSATSGATVLRIVKWSDTFETPKSRTYKRLTWTSNPADLTSSGVLQMVEDFGEEFGLMYGTWCVLVAIAANQPIRGVLANSKGKRLTSKRMSMIGHVSDTDFERLIEWCLRPNVCWIEEIPWQSLVTDPPRTQQGPVADQPVLNADQQVPLPDLTLPNLTQHNHTQPNPGGRSSVVVDWGSFGDVDFGEVERLCMKFRSTSSTSKAQVPPQTLLRAAVLTVWAVPGFITDVALEFRNGNVGKPRKYVEGSIRKACEENSIDIGEFLKRSKVLIDAHKQLEAV